METYALDNETRNSFVNFSELKIPAIMRKVNTDSIHLSSSIHVYPSWIQNQNYIITTVKLQGQTQIYFTIANSIRVVYCLKKKCKVYLLQSIYSTV